MDSRYVMTPEGPSRIIYSVSRGDGTMIYRLRTGIFRARFFDPDLQTCRFELRPQVWYRRTSDIVEQPVNYKFASLQPNSLTGDSWDLQDATGTRLAELRSVRISESGQFDNMLAVYQRTKAGGLIERTQRMVSELRNLADNYPMRALFVEDKPIVQFFRGNSASPLRIEVLDAQTRGITEPMVLAAAVKVLSVRHTPGTLNKKEQAEVQRRIRAVAAAV